jgi:hypothetical protein
MKSFPRLKTQPLHAVAGSKNVIMIDTPETRETYYSTINLLVFPIIAALDVND